MAFAVTNTFSGASTLDPDDLDQNFTDVENLVNGGLTTSNLTATAGITNAQLANSEFVFSVNLTIDSAQMAALAAGDVAALVSIPYNATGSWSVIGLSWACTDVGTRAGVFDIEWGGFTGASNAWTSVTTIKSNLSITTTADNIPGQGTETISGVTLSTAASTPRFIALRLDTDDAGLMSAADDVLTVSLLIKQSLGDY